MAKCRNYVIMIFIFLCSVLLMGMITENHPDVFVVDDNAMQWEPVIKKSFDYMFSRNEVPYVDFYQYKKMNLLGAGYYALLNPFMLLAYMINRYLFSSSCRILGIYMILLFSLGNVVMYAFLKKLDVHTGNALLMVFAYSSVSYFVDWGFYYFSFNNYFFIPFLLLAVISTVGHRVQYLVPGICLSFGLYLGHVQYACFYYMVYGLIMLFLAFKNHIRYFYCLCTNVFVGIALSIPQLLLMLQAGSSRNAVITDTEGFMAMPVSLVSLAIHFAIPKFLNVDVWRIALDTVSEKWWMNNWLNRRGVIDGISLNYIYLGMIFPLFLFFWVRDIRKTVSFIKKIVCSFHQRTISLRICKVHLKAFFRQKAEKAWQSIQTEKTSVRKYAAFFCVIELLLIVNLNGRYFVFATVCLLLAVFIIAVIKGRENDSQSDKGILLLKCDFIYAVACTAIFFLLFSYGKKGVVALFFQKIPVFNNFRFLYKAMFIAIPCMVVPAAIVLESMDSKKRIVRAAVCVLACIGVLNSWFTVNSGMSTYYNNMIFDYNKAGLDRQIEDRIHELNLDTENYRFLAAVSDHYFGNYIDTSSAECIQKITKNMATSFGVFSLGGYDSAFSYDSYRQSDFIYEDIVQNNMYTNAVNGQEYFAHCIKMVEENQSSQSIYNFYVKKLESQWRQSAIKYILADKDMVEIILEMFRYFPNVSAVDEKPFFGNTVLIELEGVDSLCIDDMGKKVEMSADLAELSVAVKGKTTVLRFSFVFDPHYRVVFVGETGEKRVLAAEKTEEGYVEIDVGDCGAGEVRLEYDSILCDADVILAATVGILSMFILVLLFYNVGSREMKGRFM